MVLFPPIARGMLDTAVQLLSDSSEKARWRDWASSHPEVRVPGGLSDDGSGPIAPPIVSIALAALDRIERRLIAERNYVPEDDRYSYDNDLALIHTIRRMLHEDQGAIQV